MEQLIKKVILAPGLTGKEMRVLAELWSKIRLRLIRLLARLVDLLADG